MHASNSLAYLSHTSVLLSSSSCIIISHNGNTLCGLIWDGFFTANWKFGFVFDPRLHDLQLLVLKLFDFVF